MKRLVVKFVNGIRYVFTILSYWLLTPIALIIFSKKNYWLISEIDFDARDNGFALFYYLKTNKKPINAIYIISKKNVNFKKVHELGETIEPHSFKHFLIFIAAKYKISTLVNGCSPSYFLSLYLKKHHPFGKNIALKHGIFKNLHPNYFKENAHLDLICCGAKPELEFIQKEFGYEQDVVKYTGLARFDNLFDCDTKNEILLMPTWRMPFDKMSIDDFKKTVFFQEWEKLLTNEKFIYECKKRDLTIVFYLHPKLNRFSTTFNFPNVVILKSDAKIGIQESLKSCKMIITDYSSVFFDIAYMLKPCIYFQFDEDTFNKDHYQKGYFDYRRDGFGDVCTNVNEVINELKNILKNNFILSSKYSKRANEFFVLRDNRNCERIYNSIKEIQ